METLPVKATNSRGAMSCATETKNEANWEKALSFVGRRCRSWAARAPVQADGRTSKNTQFTRNGKQNRWSEYD